MDERLEKALKIGNLMVTLADQKRMLKEKFLENLIYYTNGSQFNINKELLTFVNMLLSQGHETDVVLLDDNSIPVEIADLAEFYENILNLYFSASNEYLIKYSELKKRRTVEGLINHNE